MEPASESELDSLFDEYYMSIVKYLYWDKSVLCSKNQEHDIFGCTIASLRNINNSSYYYVCVIVYVKYTEEVKFDAFHRIYYLIVAHDLKPLSIEEQKKILYLDELGYFNRGSTDVN